MRARLALSTLALAALACNTLAPPRPPVEWETGPEAVIVRATFCCGFVPMEVAVNYIPDVTLWGDGHILWVEYGQGGSRRVLEGRLTEAELRGLLRRLVQAGFFGWQDSYGDYSVTDLASQCLSVHLLTASKTVCEYYRGAPAAFHHLYAELASGGGAAGTDYLPERGVVTSYPLTGPELAQGTVLRWPDGAGFSLEAAQDGRWAEGEALRVAWEAVNAGYWSHAVQDGDAYYRLTVQIPGLSQGELPPE